MEQSLEMRIRERAYEIWSAHGRPDGRADEYWLTAEREIVTLPAGESSLSRATPTRKARPRRSGRVQPR
jgi:Protein of unknown function (DUF2934)